MHAEGHRAGVGCQPLAPQTVVGIDDGAGLVHQFQQLFLGGAIGLHGAVIIQVIPAQVGEHSRGKRQGRHPVLHQTVAGDLHRHQIGPLLLQGGKIGLHLHGAACGVFRFHQFTEQAIAYGAHHPGLASQQGAPVGDQQGSGALAVGAGDAHQLQLLRRIVIEMAGQFGEASGQILDPETGDRGGGGHEFPILLKQDGGRSLSHRLFDETPAIHLVAPDCHEERTGPDSPAVELDVGERERRGMDAKMAHELIKCAGRQHGKPPNGQECRRSGNGAPWKTPRQSRGRQRETDANQVRGAPWAASVRASFAGTSGGMASGRMLKSCSTPPMASANGGVATAPP